MAQGHLIPFIDLAKLLVARGAVVTFVTTPVNLARIHHFVHSAAASSLPIRFLELPFPAEDVGLPAGCENADLIPSFELYYTFMAAQSLLRDPLEARLRIPDQWPKPSCLISDNLQHWTADVALTLDIPRLVFHGPSCFYLLCFLLIGQHRAELEAMMESAPEEPVVLPGLPQPIRINKHDVIQSWRSHPDWSKYMETVRIAEESADGVLVNSFVELEPWCFERYREVTGKRIWPVGPLSLCREEPDARKKRGRVSSVDDKILFEWLERQEAGSVVLVSFGSIARNTMAQLVELGCGLHFADQFLNERLVVDVLKTGVAVGVEEPTILVSENGDGVAVKVRRGEIERAVEMLMGGGEEGEERRVRARELRVKARMAVEEGGSSWEGLEDLINYVAEGEKTRCESKKRHGEGIC